MTHAEVVAKVAKLKAVTVARGASPAEAATAASLAQRMIRQVAVPAGGLVAPSARRCALAPGVAVAIVSRGVLGTARS
jgi:hypothetical protein